MTTSYEIHPAIGIARVGSSRAPGEDGYFLGPEPGVSPPQQYRDKAGNLKRQAARFRVFACERDERGTLLSATELTIDSVAQITWTAHLVNRKGTARRRYGSGPGYRNYYKRDEAIDRQLIIDPGPRTVSTPGEHKLFDTGTFRSTVVPLGEIEMEASGSLRVLGGFGIAGSDPLQPRLTDLTGHCVDNRNWYDDTSDGPVTVEIALHDGRIERSTAWVVVGPPDFAPELKNFVSLYELLTDLALSRNLLKDLADGLKLPSFSQHIQPILVRALNYRWVNQAAQNGYNGHGNRGHAHGAKGAFDDYWTDLADPSQRTAELRLAIFQRLRHPDPTIPKADINPLQFMPRLRNAQSVVREPDDVLPLPKSYYEVMQAWANGRFVSDLGQQPNSDELLPDAINRMVLESCVGGALDPGLEVGRDVISNPSSYQDGEPFRLSHDIVKPGEVTQYNAVPWQTDFMVCQWEEMEGPFPRRLGWWSAQRPDDVFTNVGDTEMASWIRGLGSDYQDMVDKWDRLGFVVDKGTNGSPFYVEVERDHTVLGP